MGPTLVVMAAGVGSRYGGPKQVDKVGPSGELLLEYAVFDARRSGFQRVVLVTPPDLSQPFSDLVNRLSGAAEITCVPQQLDQVPAWFKRGARARPWGTAHAVLAARGAISTSFGVVNADDFYGRPAYALAAQACREADHTDLATVIGFPLSTVLSANGPVVRAICEVNDGRLTHLQEVHNLGLSAAGGIRGHFRGKRRRFTGREIASMNFWIFPPSRLDDFAAGFEDFLRECGEDDTAEFRLPDTVDDLIQAGRASVRVRESPGPWFGLTHPEDRQRVSAELRALVNQGVYPDPLWSAPNSLNS